ncbi:MAG: sialidase family protein [Candidatus Paceibacterota bacterium]
MSSYLIKIRYQLFVLIFFSITLLGINQNKDLSISENPQDVRHLKVYYEEGKFAGWPANNGIWSWGDEILVGFVQADHMERSGHTYDVTTSRYKYARSFDGGITWAIEDAYENGQTAWTYQNQARDRETSKNAIVLTDPIDFSHPDFVITFSRITNNSGPSLFYYSYNRGNDWHGPYELPNLHTPGVATRTDYFIDGSNELSAFVTVAKQNQREGRVAMYKTKDGGISWEIKSWLGGEPEGFDIMPSSVRLSQNEILTTIRSRDIDPRRDYIKAFHSDNNGDSWEKINEPVYDTGAGGSPPALVKLQDGRLALAYIFRSKYGSRVHLKLSDDDGQSWSHEITLRSNDDATNDAGYPRMVQRSDGKLVVVYYWNHAADEDNPPYRYIAATIVDPDQWK